MPKVARALSALEVKALEAGDHAVGGVAGLTLQVRERGFGSWVLRTMVGSRRRELGLGPYPEVGLGLARERAREFKAQIRSGIDPTLERLRARQQLAEAQNRLTFAAAANLYLEKKSAEFGNAKHRAQWRSTLETYAFPRIGGLALADIEVNDIVSVLEPYWTEKTETMKRLRGRIEAVLAWGTVTGLRVGDNPARWRGNLDQVLPSPARIAKVRHHRALPIDDIPGFFESLEEVSGAAATALRFLILTAARTSEALGMTWSEVDLDSLTWTVPAKLMKAGRLHRVPLSSSAMGVLAPEEARTSRFVFPSPRRGRLSDTAVRGVLKHVGAECTIHGFRSTFRDWCAERTSYPRDVAEMALAHTIESSVEAAYRRGDLLEKRRPLMEDWARYCLGSRYADGAVPTPRAPL
ncbi:MAG: tyrosine-type recombinase/integrase [Pseudomonadales bacterium]|jgi:integrase|nr:tyrosine-type recombinase/integrase [Pseudomonadales bacterium]